MHQRLRTSIVLPARAGKSIISRRLGDSSSLVPLTLLYASRAVSTYAAEVNNGGMRGGERGHEAAMEGGGE